MDILKKPGFISGIVSIIISLIIIYILMYQFVDWHNRQEASFIERPTCSDGNLDYFSTFTGGVDDGEYNILMLGDDLLTYCTDETSIPHLVTKYTGAHVTSIAVPRATCAIMSASYDSANPSDVYSLFYLSNMISASDFSLLMTAWNDMEDSQVYQVFWDAIHTYPFEKADVIVLCYGANDYIKGLPHRDDQKYGGRFGTNFGTKGALDSAIKGIRKRCPNARIIVCSPYFFEKYPTNKKTDPEVYGEYVKSMRDVAEYNDVTFLDNYYGLPYNCQNYEKYLDKYMSGGYHFPNENGRDILAKHIVEACER